MIDPMNELVKRSIKRECRGTSYEKQMCAIVDCPIVPTEKDIREMNEKMGVKKTDKEIREETEWHREMGMALQRDRKIAACLFVSSISGFLLGFGLTLLFKNCLLLSFGVVPIIAMIIFMAITGR